MTRKVFVLALALMAMVALAASPAAAQYSPTTPGDVVGTTVAPSDPGPSTGELPRTGASDSTRTVAMVGAGLLAAGGMVLLSVRRRQTVA